MRLSFQRLVVALTIAAIACGAVLAFQTRHEESRFDKLVLHDPAASVGVLARSDGDLPLADSLRAGWASFRRNHGPRWVVQLDPRSGAPLLVEGQGIPWIPGAGDQLTGARAVTLETLEASLRAFVARNNSILLAGDDELVLDRAASGQVSPETWQVVFDRYVAGTPVHGARYTFTIGHGNLIAFGASRWGRIAADATPTIAPQEALGWLYRYMGLEGRDAVELIDAGSLSFLMLDATPGAAPYDGPLGAGYVPALAWRFVLRVSGEPGTWVGQVDAKTGGVLAFYDDNRYAQVKGGVFPESDDLLCPSGCEQMNHPMPFATVTVSGTPQTSSAMGAFTCSPPGGSATTSLTGPYIRVSDGCGAVSETVTCDNDLDLRGSGGMDCAVPTGASAGNTHSARTSFYHLNRAAEHARVWLPGNTWLTQQLTDNVNSSVWCNAQWTGAVNFYSSDGSTCNNTGEIAGVVLHEWGHGLDQNDGGGYDNPSEAYADVTEILYDHTSCVGRGFYRAQQCDGYGNACLNCTGIRDQDWDQRASHAPSTADGFIQNNCYGGGAPCGKEEHCEGYLGAETIWDLAARDLPASGMDQASAWQLVDRLWYQSRNGSSGNAYNCSIPNSDGCGTTTWFAKLRNADDDDGDLSNGTLHAAAIFAAFNRHKIACGAAGDASNQNHSSCPALAQPIVTASAGSGAAALSWNPVAGAAQYYVLRNDLSCSHSFTVVAKVLAPATNFTDAGLANGFPEHYRVQAVGSNSSCESAVSDCQVVTPQPFAGTITLDRATYGCGVTVYVSVLDANIGAPTTTATIWSTTEPTPQTLVLTETPPGSAKYVGSIGTTGGPPAADGLLSLTNGDTITAQYIDADDGMGGHNLTRQTTAVADCMAPSISGVATSGVTDVQATITWSTDQAADSVVTWGPSRPPSNVTSSPAMVTSHSIQLTGLSACTLYYFKVNSTDPSGNVALDDNGGQDFHFETFGNFPGVGLQPCHAGRVYMDRPVYSCADTVGLKIIDMDLNANPDVAETVVTSVTSTTELDPEIVTLTETGPNTSIFTGTIQTAGGVAAHDGRVQVTNGDMMTATYHDANDGSGARATSFATAVADCGGPGITNLGVADDPPFRVTITWDTAEPSSSRVDYGATTSLGSTVSDPALVTHHQLVLSVPNQCSLQYFKVTSTDAFGNTTVEDRGGALHIFETGRVPGAVFLDGFETSTGWTLEGEWQIDAPQGKGGSGYSGFPDPSRAYNGTKVLGSDLTGLGTYPGDYEPSVNISATSPQMNCQGLTSVKLIFRRWLNVEPAYADRAHIMGYNKSWTQIWVNDQYSYITESNWTRQVYDISNLAAGNRRFQLRFNIQSDSANQLSGWNIDDVIVKDGSLPDAEACGGCTSKPSFGGLKSAQDANPCADTGVTLAWQPAAAWGSGVSGTYAVYRDATPNFTPSAANRLAAGVSATTYTDAAAPNGVTLYYLVRAENNETCGTGPANSGVTDDNIVYLSARDDASQAAPGPITNSVRGQLVNGVHVRLAWSATGAAAYRVHRADNPEMLGSSVAGSPTGTFFDDVGEATTATSRFYLVNGVNSCGVEGP